MDHTSPGSLLAIAIASGTTAALVTVYAINAASDERVQERARRWSRWLGVSRSMGDPSHHCCCGRPNEPAGLSGRTPNPQAENTLLETSNLSTRAGSKHAPPNQISHSNPAQTPNLGNPQAVSETGESLSESVSKQLGELFVLQDRQEEASGGGQAPEISSIDLRTPEKLSRPLDLSLGAESPSLPGKPDPENPQKREGYLSWDDYFMSVAFLSAQRSKDPNRQVGACIVSQERIILGIGYNGFPRGCSDDQLPWAKSSKDGDLLKTKYPYVCHAELNAILNRNQASAAGQKMYVTMFPCNECAKLIIQSGISEVIYYTDKGGRDRDVGPGDARPEVAYAASKRLLKLAGIKICQHRPARSSITLDFR